MSVSLLTNHSATVSANNLSSVSVQLQRSLNRLSSGSKIVNPSDDAGGLAVSMKMGAAIKRQAAASNNISNAMSYLQTQDGAMNSASSILSRIGELKTLGQDVTKNATDKANYNTEFAALQEQLSALADEKFNGVSLFSSSTLSVKTTVDGANAAVEMGGVDLFETVASPAFSTFTDTFDDLSNWTVTGSGETTATTSSNYLTLTTLIGTGDAAVTTDESYSGPYELSLDFTPNGAFQVEIGGETVLDHPSGSTTSLRVTVDDEGNYNTYVGGSDTPYSSGSGITGSNQITLKHVRVPATSANVHIQNFSIESTAGSGSNTFDVANAGSLDSLPVSEITAAIEDIATFRAQNGAQQSRLQFAHHQLSVNQSNLEAARSRIMDVDVAEESTQLARLNVLQQAGAAMLSQANQSQQIALRLLG